MTKKYSPVSNEQRRLLVKLIYEDGLSIRQAAIGSNIYYPTAKAINKIYIAEKRIDKRQHRFRKIASKGGNHQRTSGKVGGSKSDETMLKPIREELGFGQEIYESLDDEMIDVTYDRVEEARRQTQPFDHYKISGTTAAAVPCQPNDTKVKEESVSTKCYLKVPERRVSISHTEPTAEDKTNATDGEPAMMATCSTPAPRQLEQESRAAKPSPQIKLILSEISSHIQRRELNSHELSVILQKFKNVQGQQPDVNTATVGSLQAQFKLPSLQTIQRTQQANLVQIQASCPNQFIESEIASHFDFGAYSLNRTESGQSMDRSEQAAKRAQEPATMQEKLLLAEFEHLGLPCINAYKNY